MKKLELPRPVSNLYMFCSLHCQSSIQRAAALSERRGNTVAATMDQIERIFEGPVVDLRGGKTIGSKKVCEGKVLSLLACAVHAPPSPASGLCKTATSPASITHLRQGMRSISRQGNVSLLIFLSQQNPGEKSTVLVHVACRSVSFGTIAVHGSILWRPQ